MNILRTSKLCLTATTLVVVVLVFCGLAFSASNKAAQKGSSTDKPKQSHSAPIPEATMTVIVPQHGIAVESMTVCNSFAISSPVRWPDGSTLQSYQFSIKTTGGVAPVVFSLMKHNFLPPGLKLDSDGLVTGIPQNAGKYSFRISAFDKCPHGSRSVEKQFTLAVRESVPSPEQPRQVRSVAIPDRPNGVTVAGMRLVFEGGQTNLVMERGATVPAVKALLQTGGSGVVAGYWKTPQGRKIAFRQQASAPQTEILFPVPETLRTQDPGQHEVSLILTLPAVGLPPSVARYFVIRETTQSEDTVPGQLVVSVALNQKDRVTSKLTAKYGFRLWESHELPSLGECVLVFEADDDIASLEKKVVAEKGVLLAQPNHIFRTFSEPKEKLQDLSRHLRFSKIHDISQGRGVTVAVIDTGVEVTHEDLQDNILGQENFISGETYRGEIHGTAVAGTISAGINQKGIRGVAPESKILALRACTQVSESRPQGQGNTVSITRAINTALMAKTAIVNMSFGSGKPDRLIARIIEKGAKQGVFFVAPVGNRNDLSELSFPASEDAVIAVGGMRKDGDLFPNRDLAASAAVCAPCENVFTTIPQNGYNFLSGTSISAAVVSGVLALSLEKNPSLRRQDIPVMCGNICLWTEKLMGVPLCN